MPIPESFIDDLISRTDITALISGYVPLTKRSGSNMFGLCPFHSEKTPSFSVNEEEGLFYCHILGGSKPSTLVDSFSISFCLWPMNNLGYTVPWNNLRQKDESA